VNQTKVKISNFFNMLKNFITIKQNADHSLRKSQQHYAALTFIGRCLTFGRRVDDRTSLLAVHDHQRSVLILQLLARVVSFATHLLVCVVNECIPMPTSQQLNIITISLFVASVELLGQEVDQRKLGERLWKKTVKHVD